jgi:hypothetical protein
MFNVFNWSYAKRCIATLFQIGVSFYLLYTQVGLAFLAGAVFTVILIPVNKCIAAKIGKIYYQLECFDAKYL